MTICYVVLCHNSADFVSDLFRYLYEEDAILIFHADEKAPAELKTLIDALSREFKNVQALPSRSCSWGGYSLTKVALDAVALALSFDATWSHLLLLSEQHLPLLPIAELKRRLEPRVSYFEARMVAKMYPGGQEDVKHRIARSYRELPGVGSFAGDRQALDPEWLQNLYHGSQWLILSNEACSYITQVSEDPNIWAPFTHSLLSDELAFPTGLMAGVQAGRLLMKNWSPTFVATPANGGSNDMVFSEENYFAAAETHWFIRKRPLVLPVLVRAALERHARYRDGELRAVLLAGAVPAALTSATKMGRPFFQDMLKRLLNTLHPSLKIGSNEGHAHCPKCYLTFRLPHWPQSTFVCLLSADYVSFKTLLVMQGQFTGSYEEIERNGVILSVIKARIHDIFSAHEVILSDDGEFGFCTYHSEDDILRLAHIVAQHISAAERL